MDKRGLCKGNICYVLSDVDDVADDGDLRMNVMMIKMMMMTLRVMVIFVMMTVMMIMMIMEMVIILIMRVLMMMMIIYLPETCCHRSIH